MTFHGLDLNTITLAIIQGIVAVFVAKIAHSTSQSRKAAEEVKITSAATAASAAATEKHAADTAHSIEQVHTAVNSERSQMLAKIARLREEVLALTVDKATVATAAAVAVHAAAMETLAAKHGFELNASTQVPEEQNVGQKEVR